jgi:hypothetical protein
MNSKKERRFAATPSTASCEGCHSSGRKQELPELSSNSAYCLKVFRPATTWAPPKTTMPKPGSGMTLTLQEHSYYLNHINAGSMWCGMSSPTASGAVFDITPDLDTPGHLSPPVVREPVFTCGGAVAVGGFVPGAKVELFVTEAATGIVSSWTVVSNETDSLVNFVLPQPLNKLDRLEATQIVNGVVSPASASITVLDFPGPDLPPPAFDGDKIYACADSLSVRATPGSAITVTRNGANAVTEAPGNGWLLAGVFSPAPWPTPWNVGDVFEAQAKLECVSGGQVRSWVSPKVTLASIAAPATLQAPSFEPAQTYEGQRILGVRTVTFGAFSWLTRNSPTLNLGRTFAAPDGWGANFDVIPSPLGRAIVAGERFSATPSLSCPGGPTGVRVSTPPARPCAEMPPPEIAAPRVGARTVAVLRAMPGARVRVFDSSFAEIGDGQGPLLALSRVLVAGDVLQVTQTAGTCTTRTAFVIPALMVEP